ncbi:MAG: uncharacterized protein PWQ96_2350 [Clostridia bacterium]|jgi:predicted nucleotidyltransferase|nr:polymerase beta domain protein region [Clostridiales bacterium]MDK2986706.1 uncharacterized protein [Clostridia bacterium]
MHYGPVEEALLLGLVKHLNTLYPDEILKVQLFGSRARGDAGAGSDFDILIIVKDKMSIDRMKIYDYILDVNLEYGLDFSLKIYDKEEFERSKRLGLPFMKNILTEGQELWAR